MTHGLQFVLTLRHKNVLTHRAINKLRVRSAARLQDRLRPPSFYASDDFWDHISIMINQTIDFNRLTFFEVLPESDLLVARSAADRDGSLQINEFSWRDELYRKIFDTRTPGKVDEFFKKEEGPLDQYLCPLTFSGEVLGAWVLSIDASDAKKIPQFSSVLSDCSHQIAQMIFHRRKFQDREKVTFHFKKWFTLDKDEEACEELSNTLSLLKQHFTILENLLGGMSSAIVVYDVFGRVLDVNEKMFDLLNEEGHDPHKISAMELIKKIGHKDETQIRALLRHVIFEHTEISLPARLKTLPKSQFVLRLRPLPLTREVLSDPAPFLIRGIVCELLDVTSFTNLVKLKGMINDSFRDSVTQRFCFD